MQDKFFDLGCFLIFTKMDSLELTDEQLSLAKVMVDDYAPDDEDEEELKDSIAEKLKSNVLELSDEQLRFFHIIMFYRILSLMVLNLNTMLEQKL